MSTEAPSRPAPDESGDVGLLDFLVVLAKYRKLIGGVSLGAAAVALIVCLLLPNSYVGTTTLLPPQQSPSTTNALLAQFGALMGVGGVGGGSPLAFRNPNDLYVGMLKSRTVADGLIARFELQKVYDEERLSDARKKLARKTSIVAGRDGIITVEFDDTDPGRAAAVANGYVEELYKLTMSMAITEASQRRLFFENQLKEARAQLIKAEVALRQAIDAKGLAGVDVQSRAILEPSAQLRAQIALREVQVSAIQVFATEQHPDITRLRHEIASMKRELSKLEGGDGNAKSAPVSQEGMENLRRFREVKFLERLSELLAQQFEAAKIDEAKDMSIIQVLDKAVEPDRRSGPPRTAIVVVSALVAGLLVVIWALLREWAGRADPENRRRLDSLQGLLAFRRGRQSPTR